MGSFQGDLEFNNLAWPSKEVFFCVLKNNATKHGRLCFVWSYFQVRIVCWGNILLDVNQRMLVFTQAGHEVLLRISTFGSVTQRGCMIWKLTQSWLFLVTLNWKRVVSGRRHASNLQRHVKQGAGPGLTQWLFALGIIFQLAWHVREAALPREPVQHSKQTRAPWQAPAWEWVLLVLTLPYCKHM